MMIMIVMMMMPMMIDGDDDVYSVRKMRSYGIEEHYVAFQCS